MQKKCGDDFQLSKQATAKSQGTGAAEHQKFVAIISFITSKPAATNCWRRGVADFVGGRHYLYSFFGSGALRPGLYAVARVRLAASHCQSSFFWIEFRFEPFDQLCFVIHPYGITLPILHPVWSAFDSDGVEFCAGFDEFICEFVVLGEETIL